MNLLFIPLKNTPKNWFLFIFAHVFFISILSRRFLSIINSGVPRANYNLIFRMSRSRNWLCTLNNPTEDPEGYLKLWHTQAKATYVCGQLEKGQEGTPHIQFFLNFGQPKRLAALKKHCKKAHFEIVKVNNGAHDYCMKEESRLEGPWEFGIKPIQRNNKTDWASVWKNA